MSHKNKGTLVSAPTSCQLLLLAIITLWSACDLINPEESLPAYLTIESFEFSTSPEQGVNSSQITDAWVFVEGVSMGIFELPATVPTLTLGNSKITVFPVIRENGVRSTPIIYPFYDRYEIDVELTAEQTITIQPTTKYTDDAVFELVESFNSSNQRLNGGNPDAVEVEEGVGVVDLSDKELVEFTSSATFIDLPTSGGFPVFLEFDYQTNVEFEVGLLGRDPNPVNPVNATIYKVILCPIDRWNKVYINFQPELEASQLLGYRLAFRASTTDTGCGNVATANQKVLIDNVKFIRRGN
ncbi:MAG: hypothetical protein AAF960_10475 [Bacteroidota bacterium]